MPFFIIEHFYFSPIILPMKEINQNIQAFLKNYLLIDGEWNWLLISLFILFTLLLLSWLIQKIVRKLEKNKGIWNNAVVYAVRKPVHLILWLFGINLVADLAYEITKYEPLEDIPLVTEIGILISITWFLLRLIDRAEDNILEKKTKIERSTADAISKLLKAVVFIVAILMVLQTFGVSVAGILAFGGVGGIAIGFAAKDLLANFFGAIMLYFDRPFVVGNWIRSPDREIEGTVEEIGWRLTRIRTFDKRPLYVPNSVFTTIAVENPSRMTHRRIKQTIGVRYDDISKVETITLDVKNMLINHPDIDENQTLIVHLDEFAAYSVNFFIYCFTHTTNWIRYYEIKQDILLKISDIIAKNEAEIAFPTQVVHFPEGAEGGLE